MTTTAIRARLYDYIRTADDKKIENIYSLFEDQMAPAVDWAEDEDFIAELDERVRRYEAGLDKTYTMEEVKAELTQLQETRENFLNQYNKQLDEAEAKINEDEDLTRDEIKKIVADSKKLLDMDYKVEEV